MITIISGTNRINSNSLKVAQIYYNLLMERKASVRLFSLERLPDDFIEVSKYTAPEKSSIFYQQQKQILIPTEKYIFILPEYNGSIPGILKLLLDSCDIEKCFYHKKACLVGLASGRGGNVRGLDHITNILHYLKMDILPNKLPISKIHEELDDAGDLISEKTLQVVNHQIDEYLKF